MESAKSFIVVFYAVVLFFFCISSIGTVFVAAIMFFYQLFSSTKCPNCAKAIRTKAIRCPRCASSLREEPPQDERESMNAELYARVKALVAEQTGVSEEKLNPDTHLADDLGIASDDGYELLEAFCEAFDIENVSEIDYTEYFGTEGFNPFYIYVMFYYLAFDREKLRDSYSFTPLYLRDLVKSAEAKKWIPPEAK